MTLTPSSNECPYKQECATVIYHAEQMSGFIDAVCNTNAYKGCTHYTFSLKPQHDERERLHGDPHYGEPDWGKEAEKALEQ